LPAKLFVQTIW